MAEASRNMDFERAARCATKWCACAVRLEGESEADVLKDLKKSARRGSAFGNRKHSAYGSSRRS